MQEQRQRQKQKRSGGWAKTARRRRNSGSRGLPRRSLTLGILAETRNPPPASPIGLTAEGLDHRFLWSQPHVIGSGSLRRARPRRSDSHHITQPETLKIRSRSQTENHS